MVSAWCVGVCSGCTGLKESSGAVICLSAHTSVCLSAARPGASVLVSRSLSLSEPVWLCMCAPQGDGSKPGRGGGSSSQITVCTTLSTLQWVQFASTRRSLWSCCSLCSAQSHIFVCVQDKEPRGIIPLENLSIKEVEDKKPVSTAPSTGLTCEQSEQGRNSTALLM